MKPQAPLWKLIGWGVGEFIVWIGFCALLLMSQTCPLSFPFRQWCDDGFWLKNLLPQSDHDGWGGLSFISVATGLNLALVKLEAFIKSLESVKSEWIKEVEKELIGEGSGGALADPNTAKQAEDVLRIRCTKLIDEINEENSALWRLCRAFAKRCTYLGFVFLFFQYSAGFLALILLFPAIGTFAARWFCTRKLFNNVKASNDMKAELIAFAQRNSKKGKVQIARSLRSLKKTISEE